MDNMTEIEKDRAKRIADNKKRLAALMEGVQTDLLM